MTGERWARLKAVFADALEQPPDRRRAWLAHACEGDPGMGTHAEAMLDAYEQDPTFLEGSAQFNPVDLAEALHLEPPSPTLLPGTILGDRRYQIVSVLGRGGMGIVYLAQDLRLPLRVALKSLPDSAARDPIRLERLRREAWAAASISHPAIAAVYAFEEFGGRPFIVSEYVRGRVLRHLLEQGAVEPGRAVAIAIEIVRALVAAHEQGVVHRDLKPENVLLTEEGSVKVVDFGVAQLTHDAPGLTQTGTWLGTPAYMAPEQANAGPVDGRADIFSFGILLAEMLTGRHPLRARTSAAHAPAAGTAAPLESAGRSIQGPLGEVVKRCVQLLPDERYGSARELLQALERASGFGAAAEPERTPAIWWWAFHQVATAAAYTAMAVVAWQALGPIGRLASALDGLFAVALLASVIVSASLRLNLWFTARHFPEQLPGVRRQRRPWILAADIAFIAVLIAAGGLLLVLQQERPLALALMACGIGAAVALTLIEPVTAQGAFGERDTEDRRQETGDRRKEEERT